MAVSSIQNAVAATSASASSPPKSGVLTSDFTTFLKMLTTQMQNQDPMNPIESSDYAVQLATFSGVEQQVRTNQLLESLASQMGGNGIAQYAGWVGMEAQVTAPVAFYGQPVTLDPVLKPGADRGTLVVRDAHNREAARLVVAPGSGQVVWDGTDGNGQFLPQGLYSFGLESLKGGDVLGTDMVAAYARVAEVRGGAAGARLVLEGGSEVKPADITALRAYAGQIPQ